MVAANVSAAPVDRRQELRAGLWVDVGNMRVHRELDDDLVGQVDKLAGGRGRSSFVRAAVERAVRRELRWSDIEAAAGVIPGEGHDWDADPAGWVRQQRRGDPRRAG